MITTQTSLSGSATAGLSFASSSGNLATGELKAFAHSAPPLSQIYASLAAGNVELRETIHIQGNISSPMTGILTTELDGSLMPTQSSDPHFDAVSAFVQFQPLVNGSTGVPGIDSYLFQAFGCSHQSCMNGTTIHTQVSTPFTISDSLRDVEIVVFLSANTQGGGLADVSHTAALDLTLPAGLTFTSDSGVFLTQSPNEVPSSVPEPGTVVLLSTGLVGLLGYGWRQRKRTALAAALTEPAALHR